MKFLGYKRADGSVGVRNYIAVIPTVGCANEVVSKIANQVDGVIPLLHHQGCCILPPDLKSVTRTLIGLGKNPNVAGVLIVSLGCEGVSIEEVEEGIAESKKPVESIVIQNAGGSVKAVAQGIEIVEKMKKHASVLVREPVDISNLIVGVKCGVSDATSGIASNPVVGEAMDMIIKNGGTVIFGETTEIMGAEHLLAKRALNKSVSDRIYKIVANMEKRVKQVGVDMRGGQPTPGNIKGGLTTIEEKSLGAVVKGGSTVIKGVLNYAEKPLGKGLYVMDSPGNEMYYLPGPAAAGAQIIVFTTGRGAPQGFPIVPVIKVCGNPKTCEHLSSHIDIDVSKIISDEETIHKAAERVYDKIVKVASGELTKAEELGYNQTFDIYINGPII